MMKQWMQRFIFLLTIMLLSGSAMAADQTIGQYGMLPVYGFDIEEGAYSVTLETDCALLQVSLADITVEDGTIVAKVLPASSRITAMSTEKEPQNNAINPNQDGIFTFGVKSMDTVLSMAVYDEQTQKWEPCSLLFRADSLPKDSLRIELPDYDLIERAIDKYQGNSADAPQSTAPTEAVSVDLPDGEYSVSIELTGGGSGKAYISSPALMTVRDGKAYVRLEWSSSNYDYMIVGTKTYYNTAEEERNSVFEIPITCWDTKMTVIADTTAMGTPHEVQYDIVCYQSSIGDKNQLPQEGAKRVVLIALVIILAGGMLNHFIKKKRSV